LHLVATHNLPPPYAEVRRDLPFRPNPRSVLGRMAASKEVVHYTDLAAEPDYVERCDPATVAAVELGGGRTGLALPMLEENELIGILFLPSRGSSFQRQTDRTGQELCRPSRDRYRERSVAQ